MRMFPFPRPARAVPIAVCGLALAASLTAYQANHSPAAARSGQFGAKPPANPATPLTATDVDTIIQRAAQTVGGNTLSIAVVDRTGKILAVWHRPGATPQIDEIALSLARTGAFFGHDQAPLTSRTVRFISGIHFPPGVRNQPNADLYGIENTNRVDRKVTFNPGKFFPPPVNVEGDGPSLGITTGKANLLDSIPYPQAVNPAGLPIYKEDDLGRRRQVGGIGIMADENEVPRASREFAALVANGIGAPFSVFDPNVGEERSFGPPPIPSPGVVFVAGIKLPLFNNKDVPPNHVPGLDPASETGFYRKAPIDGDDAPTGWLVGPTAAPGGELTQQEVEDLILKTLDVGQRIRAAIRLPVGSRARFIISVSDTQGNILGTYRDTDATVFSLDVSIAKARNVVYFSGPDRLPSELPGLPIGTAVTNRTISFGAQPLFPPGINDSRPGPFYDLFLFDTANPGTNGMQAPNGRQNGIVFFPGSAPLYKNGVLVGGIGVSGDGVDQDDTATFYGSRRFQAPERRRADQFRLPSRRRDGTPFGRVRMPYFKFARNPFK